MSTTSSGRMRPANASGEEPCERDATGPRRRVASVALIVEDDLSLRGSLMALFEEEGYEAIGVSRLDEARASLASRKPGVLVLDLTLEGEFGGDLLAELAEAEAAPATVIVSAFRLAKLVADRYGVPLVGKPFDLSTLVTQVRDAERDELRPRRR
jgi:DNA-binding response OmpR family regulator